MSLALLSGAMPWLIGGSVATCLVAIAVTGVDAAPEVVLGMAGPLVSAVVTGLVRERTPLERLGSVMMTAFGVKLLFFAAYVVVVLRVLDLEPRAFIASFTCYYVALHLVEALLLKRQLAGTPPVFVSAAIAGDGVRQER